VNHGLGGAVGAADGSSSSASSSASNTASSAAATPGSGGSSGRPSTGPPTSSSSGGAAGGAGSSGGAGFHPSGRRPRTVFDQHQLMTLKTYYRYNTNPNSAEITRLAHGLGLDRRVVKVRHFISCL
jgi:hypothetical protein